MKFKKCICYNQKFFKLYSRLLLYRRKQFLHSNPSTSGNNCFKKKKKKSHSCADKAEQSKLQSTHNFRLAGIESENHPLFLTANIGQASPEILDPYSMVRIRSKINHALKGIVTFSVATCAFAWLLQQQQQKDGKCQTR